LSQFPTKEGARGRSVAAGAVLLIAAFLIFFRLDQRLLWVDEAETALLARNILTYGVPKAYDGKTLISQEASREFSADYVWRWTPWLEKYLAAASFGVLGESTLTARLPFALLGFLSVVSVYFCALAWFRDRWVGVLAMAFLTFSVPFLLQVRQCRYYGLSIFTSIWVLYFFMALVRGRRGATLGLTVALTALFHSNCLTAIAVGVALVPCALCLGLDRRVWRQAALAAAGVIVLNLPWVLYSHMLSQGGERLQSFAENLHAYAELTSRYTFPVAALAVFLMLAWLLRGSHALLDADTWRPFLALLVLMVVDVVVLSAAPWSFYRWSINLLPLAAVLLAFMCCGVVRWHPLVGGVFSVCLLFTGILHQASAWPLTATKYKLAAEGRSFPLFDTYFPLGNYLHEVTHPFVGPMEGLLQLLTEQARPDDRIFISYGDLVLKFYTAHEVRGGQSGQTLKGWPEPEWLIIRSFVRFGKLQALKADYENMLAWLNNDVPRQDYESVPAPWVDGPSDNIAEPQLHWYRVPEQGEQMQVFRRGLPLPTPPAAP